MKKLHILYLLFCLIALDLYAQETIETFEKNAGWFHVKGLADNGFLLLYDKKAYNHEIQNQHSAHSTYLLHNKYEIELRKYSNDFKLQWEKQLDCEPEFFPSIDGKYSFIRCYSFSKTLVTKYFSDNYFGRIDSEGNIVEMNYKLNDQILKLRDFAVGKQYYSLFTYKEKKDEEIKDGILHLLRVDFDTKKINIIDLELPERKISVNCTGWRYAAHTNNNIYLCSRKIDPIKKQYECEIIVLNTDGKIINQIAVKNETKECMYPAISLHTFPANIYYDNRDVMDTGEEGFWGAQVSGYSNVLIDTLNQCFYIYGLQGNCIEYDIFGEAKKTAQATIRPGKKGHLATSVYVHKYNFKGELLFKHEENIPSSLQNEWNYYNNQLKVIAARITKENNIEICPMTLVTKGLSPTAERIVIHILISSDGQTLNKREIHYVGKYLFDDDPNTIFSTDSDVISPTNGKVLSFNVYDTGKGEIVVRSLEKEKVTKLQVYKN